jgi:hypothetical protein
MWLLPTLQLPPVTAVSERALLAIAGRLIAEMSVLVLQRELTGHMAQKIQTYFQRSNLHEQY